MSSQSAAGLKLAAEYIPPIGMHVGIEVPDIEEGRRFYCDLLGFKEDWRIDGMQGELVDKHSGIPGAKVWVAHLIAPGGSRIELQQYEPQGRIGEHAVNNQGLNHICWHVEDTWAEYERLRAAGVTFNSEPVFQEVPGHPVDGWTTVYFQDPWGLKLELYGHTAGVKRDSGEIIP